MIKFWEFNRHKKKISLEEVERQKKKMIKSSWVFAKQNKKMMINPWRCSYTEDLHHCLSYMVYV